LAVVHPPFFFLYPHEMLKAFFQIFRPHPFPQAVFFPQQVFYCLFFFHGRPSPFLGLLRSGSVPVTSGQEFPFFFSAFFLNEFSLRFIPIIKAMWLSLSETCPRVVICPRRGAWPLLFFQRPPFPSPWSCHDLLSRDPSGVKHRFLPKVPRIGSAYVIGCHSFFVVFPPLPKQSTSSIQVLFHPFFVFPEVPPF